MRLRFRALLVAAGLLAAAVPALAHHSLFAVFDEGQTVTLKGMVSKVEWVNPHVYLYLEVPDSAGKVTTWSVETFSPLRSMQGGDSTRASAGLAISRSVRGVISHGPVNIFGSSTVAE